MGSPPRMRGKGPQRGPWRGAPGITPAYAGKSFQPFFHPPRWRDHPRVCGEKPVAMHTRMTSAGSPPRMRGKALPKRSKAMKHGITPAYAGKSTPDLRLICRNQDHPRVCGEKRFHFAQGRSVPGSPPRMRGKAEMDISEWPTNRITPAYAGKSSLDLASVQCCRDHPRVCGEKVVLFIMFTTFMGSPPRMRGKGHPMHPGPAYTGITPAYAGKRSARSAACLAG